MERQNIVILNYRDAEVVLTNTEWSDPDEVIKEYMENCGLKESEIAWMCGTPHLKFRW